MRPLRILARSLQPERGRSYGGALAAARDWTPAPHDPLARVQRAAFGGPD